LSPFPEEPGEIAKTLLKMQQREKCTVYSIKNKRSLFDEGRLFIIPKAIKWLHA
jgi:hypothetical protein